LTNIDTRNGSTLKYRGQNTKIIVKKVYNTFKNTQYDKINRFNKCPCITFNI